jgi:hypothetical protein
MISAIYTKNDMEIGRGVIIRIRHEEGVRVMPEIMLNFLRKKGDRRRVRVFFSSSPIGN